MIDAIYLQPYYWVALIALMGTGSFAIRARPLDFKFIALGFLSQYVVHSFIAFGPGSDIAIFCASFWLIFVAVLNPGLKGLLFRALNRASSQRNSVGTLIAKSKAKLIPLDNRGRATLMQVERAWIWTAKWFLLVYWSCRLAFYPYILGDLQLNVRLAASQDNRVLFFLGLAVVPAIAACIALWIRKGYRFKLIDYAVIIVVVVGYVGSGSKASILPIVFVFFGALSFFRKPLREMKLGLALMAAAGVVFFVRYVLILPGPALAAAAKGLLYRVAANTDSLEYLLVINKSPSDYPFAGPGALVPMLLKPFGFVYEFPPGVWLHGTRFDVWAGYGPNPGVVMDYFGNLGWLGLLVPLVAGLYILGWTRMGGAIGLSFMSIAYLLFVDVTLFDYAFFFWAGVLVVLLALLFLNRLPRVRLLLARFRLLISPRKPRSSVPEDVSG